MRMYICIYRFVNVYMLNHMEDYLRGSQKTEALIWTYLWLNGNEEMEKTMETTIFYMWRRGSLGPLINSGLRSPDSNLNPQP